jgi:hypothetical protein
MGRMGLTQHLRRISPIGHISPIRGDTGRVAFAPNSLLLAPCSLLLSANFAPHIRRQGLSVA